MTIQTPGQKKDTLSDTIKLIYTGIPVVIGLNAVFDTLNGVMIISWNSAGYSNLQNYLLYRQDDTTKIISQNIYAVLTDTIFYDTIYHGTDPIFDTSSYTYQYRVKIRNKIDNEGNTFGFVTGTAVPRPINASLLQNEKVIIICPALNVGLSGIANISGFADTTITELLIKISSVDSIVVSGAQKWQASFDSRLLFPAESTVINILAFKSQNIVYNKSIKFNLNNIDPIIGNWSANSGYGSGTMTFSSSGGFIDHSNVFLGASSWTRVGNQIIINNSSNTPIYPIFTDYDHMSFGYYGNPVICVRQ